MKLDDPRLAQLITDLVDRRAQIALARLPQTRYGVVSAVDAVTRTCSVKLGGSALASPGFIFGGRDVPAVGDAVRVVIAGADRYVDGLLAAAPGESIRIGRSVFANASQSIPDATQTRIVHQVVGWADDGTTTYGTGSMIIGRAGLYLVSAHIEYASNNTGPWRVLGIGRNAGGHPTVWGGFGTPSANTYAVSYGTPNAGTIRHRAAFVVPLAVNDWLASFAYQQQAPAAALAATNAELTIVRLGQ